MKTNQLPNKSQPKTVVLSGEASAALPWKAAALSSLWLFSWAQTQLVTAVSRHNLDLSGKRERQLKTDLDQTEAALAQEKWEGPAHVGSRKPGRWAWAGSQKASWE